MQHFCYASGMSHAKLRHAEILPKGAQAHLTRSVLATSRPKSLHDQDFYELIWVQNGNVRHHLEGQRDDLVEGDVLFIRPQDKHALQGRGEAPFVAALCIDPKLIEGLPKRYPELAGALFWSPADRPQKLHRNSLQLATLNQAANTLERTKRGRLAVEAFLLPVLSEMLPAQNLPADAPEWLIAACEAARDPRVFHDGAAGLVRTTGRGHPHVSRSMRRWLGQSPSDYVNAQRMAFAAARLTGGSDSLSEIAEEIGIPNLSHFHKLFRGAHGMTPQKYRRTHQRNILQPG